MQKQCQNCRYCKKYEGMTNGFWCDYLGGLVYWESVKKRTMCGEEGWKNLNDRTKN